ncbi:YetF domain-containing protein [Paenibacillus agricola]|uniref:YetF domain-containing protein n=1 Tax=Paenibacillus agricola TaxID=2716264 RepID=UPI001FB5C4F0|nr:YetF domain-containing protein [Paenibacillus agricola]
MPTTLITDGEIIWDNLKVVGYDNKWLELQIQSQGIDEVKNVLYAEWKENEGIYIVPYS